MRILRNRTSANHFLTAYGKPLLWRYTTLRITMSKPIRCSNSSPANCSRKFDEEANMLEDVAIIQSFPPNRCSDDDASLRLSFRTEFKAHFREHFMYEYKKLPDDLETKYLKPHQPDPVHGASPCRGKSPLIKYFVPLRRKPPILPRLSDVGEAFPQPRRLRTPPYERTPLPAAPPITISYRGSSVHKSPRPFACTAPLPSRSVRSGMSYLDIKSCIPSSTIGRHLCRRVYAPCRNRSSSANTASASPRWKATRHREDAHVRVRDHT